MNLRDALKHYETLRDRVSEKFSSVEKKYKSEFQCGRGCHSCCKPELTVSPIEAAAIAKSLPKNFVAFGKDRCAFLDKGGSCTIYEVRPIVCRSHGAPLQVKDNDDVSVRDVCPLNFTGMNLSDVPATDILNLDTVNALLATLNIHAFGKKNSSKRIALTKEAILNSSQA